MIKRMNKVTSLLVAAAAVISLAPITGVSAAERLETKTGTIDSAIAFNGGNYIYDGYKTSDDATGVYYNAGDKDKQIEDFNADSITKYGDKYAKVMDGSDEYVVDLSTGQVVADETTAEDQDAAQAKLATALKKADRYNDVVTKTSDLDGKVEQILKGQFGEVWYQYNTSIAGANGVGSTKGVIKVNADSTKGTLTIAGKAFTKDDTAGSIAGYKSIADFATRAAATAYTNWNVVSVDSATGEVTLEQKIAGAYNAAALNAETGFKNVQTTLVKEGLVAQAANVAGTQAVIEVGYAAAGVTPQNAGVNVATSNIVGGFTVTTVDAANNKIILTETTPSAYNSISSTDLTAINTLTGIDAGNIKLTTTGAAGTNVGVDAQKAIVKVTSSDFTKDVEIFGNTFTAYQAVVKGFADQAGLVTAINAATFDGYTAVATLGTGSNADVVLTQTTATDLNQSNIAADKFNNVTAVVTVNGVAGTDATAVNGFIGFADQTGNYIDASYIANMYVYSKATGTVKKIENFGEEDKDTKLKVDLVSLKAIDQDKDYIYAIATVNVTGDGAVQGTQKFLQKISKEKGDKQDGAYLPKSVTSYQITDAYDSGDADDAVTSIDEAQSIRVINDVVYATKIAADKVTVTTIKLKKDKVAIDGATNKVDTYLAEQDVQEDQDIAAESAVSIDVNGNTWAVNKGEIFKFDGTKFTSVYNCDRAFDTLEVYNADSLIAWEAGQDAYATVGKQAETPVTPVQTKGWANTAAGWTFYDATANQVKAQWVKDNGVWYMIKADGIMATGWYNDNGTWYYLAGSGSMQTGWINDNGTWYYLAGSGAMKTGWVNDNGTWYYLAGSGAMLANTTIDGYKLGASGAWTK